MLTIKCNDIKQ